jgi:hypothetical protein
MKAAVTSTATVAWLLLAFPVEAQLTLCEVSACRSFYDVSWVGIASIACYFSSGFAHA